MKDMTDELARALADLRRDETPPPLSERRAQLKALERDIRATALTAAELDTALDRVLEPEEPTDAAQTLAQSQTQRAHRLQGANPQVPRRLLAEDGEA